MMKDIVPLRMSLENRASKVSLLGRISNALMGSPLMSKANGLDESVGIVNIYKRMARPIIMKDAPVYQIDRMGTRRNERLPRIWLSEPEIDTRTGLQIGRRFTDSYPKGSDIGGNAAFDIGQRYFAEGISSIDCVIKKECFQAAEILYLHAAQRGNISALSKLGIIYRYDMCEGDYWKDVISAHAKHSDFQREAKAYRAFARAAARGDSEAKWNLGDLTKEGIGCNLNKCLAFNLYCGAFRKAVGCSKEDVFSFTHKCNEHSFIVGNVCSTENAACSALRIAECYESGIGCEADLITALNWYSVAEAFACMSVGKGCWYYKKELAQAKFGTERVLRKAS